MNAPEEDANLGKGEGVKGAASDAEHVKTKAIEVGMAILGGVWSVLDKSQVLRCPTRAPGAGRRWANMLVATGV